MTNNSLSRVGNTLSFPKEDRLVERTSHGIHAVLDYPRSCSVAPGEFELEYELGRRFTAKMAARHTRLRSLGTNTPPGNLLPGHLGVDGAVRRPMVRVG